MNTLRCLIAGTFFSAFWCLGVFILLPRMEAKLSKAAREALSAQQTLASRLGHVQADFNGQVAHLTGQVRCLQDKVAIEATVRDRVHAPTLIASNLGWTLNPVSAIRNEIEISPYPPGWILLASNGSKAKLYGEAASDFEARDLALSIMESWSAKGGNVTSRVLVNSEDHDESPDISATLGSLPPPSSNVELHLARIGERWQKLALAEGDTSLRHQAAALGVKGELWEKDLAPLVAALRRDHIQATEHAKQNARLEKLPLGHLFIAARGAHLILKGEVGSDTIKRALLDEAIHVFTAHRIQDDIRVNAERRPIGGFDPLTTALLPTRDAAEEKAFYLGISGQDWLPLDWRGSPKEPSWKEKLPPDLDPALLHGDNAQLIEFLQGSDVNLQPITRTRPAFIVLALVGKKALVSGQIAEPALHAQFVAAVKAAYAPGVVTMADFFVVNGLCQPSHEVLHTAKSLPVRGTKPLLAFARPGGSWQVREVTPALVEPGALAKSGLLPQDISPNLVEEAAADTLEQLRALIFHQSTLSPAR